VTLWPDIDQERAFDNLRPVLSELRKALGDQGARLQSPSHDTLLLDLNGADVDVAAFDWAIARGTPDTLGIAWSLNGLSQVMLDQGELAGAGVLLAESLSLFLPLSDKCGVARSLDGIAAVLLALGVRERAAHLWGAAHSLREGISVPIPPGERGDFDYRMEQIRYSLFRDNPDSS